MSPTYPKDCHFCGHYTYFGSALCVNALCLQEATADEDAHGRGGRARQHRPKRRRTGNQAKRDKYWAERTAARRETRALQVRPEEQDQAREEAEEAQAHHLASIAKFEAYMKRQQAAEQAQASATVSGLPPHEAGDEEDESWGHWGPQGQHQDPRNRPQDRRPKTPPRPRQKKRHRSLCHGSQSTRRLQLQSLNRL